MVRLSGTYVIIIYIHHKTHITSNTILSHSHSKGDGSVTYGMRFTTTLACMMDLHYYPLDSQNCTVEIESCKCFTLLICVRSQFIYECLFFTQTLDGYTVSDVVMYWRSNIPIRGVEEAELPQFTIIGYETNDRKVSVRDRQKKSLKLIVLDSGICKISLFLFA